MPYWGDPKKDCPHGVVQTGRCACCTAGCDPAVHSITGYPALFSRRSSTCPACSNPITQNGMRIRLDLMDKKWKHDVCVMDLVHSEQRPPLWSPAGTPRERKRRSKAQRLWDRVTATFNANDFWCNDHQHWVDNAICSDSCEIVPVFFCSKGETHPMVLNLEDA